MFITSFLFSFFFGDKDIFCKLFSLLYSPLLVHIIAVLIEFVVFVEERVFKRIPENFPSPTSKESKFC